MSKNVSTSFAVTVIVIVAGFIGLVIWKIGQQPAVETTVSVPMSKQASASPSNQVVYENKKYGFSITLPKSWEGYKTVDDADSVNIVLPAGEPGWSDTDDPSLSHYASILRLVMLPNTDAYLDDLKDQKLACDQGLSTGCLRDYEAGRTNQYVVMIRLPQDIPQSADFQKKWFDTGYSHENPLGFVDFFKKGFKAFDPSSVGTADWKTYRNDQYGFEIRYPKEYELVQDKSGWPHSVGLLIEASGYAQSYALPIEVWSSEADLRAERGNQVNEMIIKTLGDGKIVTLWNQNKIKEVDQVIAAFKLVE